MSAAWVVSGLLYALGYVMAYAALIEWSEGRLGAWWLAAIWPICVGVSIVAGLYDRFIGDRLWRRAHRKWCEASRAVDGAEKRETT